MDNDYLRFRVDYPLWRYWTTGGFANSGPGVGPIVYHAERNGTKVNATSVMQLRLRIEDVVRHSGGNDSA